MDCSPPGPSVHGILQERLLGWAVILCLWPAPPSFQTWPPFQPPQPCGLPSAAAVGLQVSVPPQPGPGGRRRLHLNSPRGPAAQGSCTMRASPWVFSCVWTRHWLPGNPLQHVGQAAAPRPREVLTLPRLAWCFSDPSVSCLVVSNSSQPHRLLCPWAFPGKNTGVGCHFLLQGIFLTQGSNPSNLCVLHCRQIIYLLSRQGRRIHVLK